MAAAAPGIYDYGYAAPALSHSYAAPVLSHSYAAPVVSHSYAAPVAVAAPVIKTVAAPV